jgi:hypothetical protein
MASGRGMPGVPLRPLLHTANTYSHVMLEGGELDYAALIAEASVS